MKKLPPQELVERLEAKRPKRGRPPKALVEARKLEAEKTSATSAPIVECKERPVADHSTGVPGAPAAPPTKQKSTEKKPATESARQECVVDWLLNM